MANLSYSTSIQNKVAYRLFERPYSNLDANQKAMIDNTSSASPPTDGLAEDAWNYINDYAQLVYLSGAGNAPDTWERWLVARICYLAGQVVRPDRQETYWRIEQDEKKSCVSMYVTADPNGSAFSTDATQLTTKAIRFYALNALMKQVPEIAVSAADFDHAILKVMQDVWYRADWIFKRRPVTMHITPYNLTGVTWTESSKKLTLSTANFTNIPTNQIISITDGTGVTVGNYRVSSSTTTELILTTSIGAGADGQTDIELNFVVVTYDLTNSEVFHKPATRKWYCTDNAGIGAEMMWANDGDGFVSGSVFTQARSARPFNFRYYRTPTTSSNWTYQWQFSPIPDQAYTLRGECFIACPDAPSSSTDETKFAMFPKEMWPIIKDMVFWEIFRKYRAPEASAFLKQINEEFERIVPLYVNQGNADADTGIRDVNKDPQSVGSQMGWWYGSGALGGMGWGGGGGLGGGL